MIGQDSLESLDQALGEVTESSIAELQAKVRVLEAENDKLYEEVDKLNASLETLHAEYDDRHDESLVSLEEENTRLRKSLRLMYGGRIENLPDVPMPNRDLLVDILSDANLGVQ